MHIRRWILTLGMTFCLAGGSLSLLSGCGESQQASGLAPPPDEARVQAEQKATQEAMQKAMQKK